jgi:fibrillarin-like pre-rRNA processing protein
MRRHVHSGIHTDGTDLFTRLLKGAPPGPGRTVEGEDGLLYRSFPPTATKLSAMVKLGMEHWPFAEDSRVLYLGAASGTTVSYVSDICPRGQIFAVEFAPVPFRSLVDVARGRPNVVPILADARKPSAYAVQVGPPVDVLYQDVAQRDQWDIGERNAQALLSLGGTLILVVKAASVDISRPAPRIFRAVAEMAAAGGFAVLEMVDIGTYDRDHGVLVAKRR